MKKSALLFEAVVPKTVYASNLKRGRIKSVQVEIEQALGGGFATARQTRSQKLLQAIVTR